MKYEVEVVKLGDMVEEFIEGKMIILFNDNAPPELAEISVIHTIDVLKGDVCKGDTIKIGDIEYLVTTVGNEANKTLKQLGHCTLKFNGADEADLPGVISLEDKQMPNIKIGDKIVIY